MAKMARGERNNNPGNIRRREDVKWQGEVPNSADIDPEFEVFVSPEWGIRAIVKQIRTYHRRDKDGVLTIAEAIKIYAPPNENKTDKYIEHVAKRLKKTGSDPINVFDPTEMFFLVEAIITMELGYQPYPVQLIRQGISMGLE